MFKGSNEDCSFEYSKAEEIPAHLLNESSFDQLISEIETTK